MKTLPQNLTAEQAAVSILAQCPAAFSAFAWDEKLFADPTCKVVFRHVADALSCGEPTDIISMTARLDGRGDLETVGGAYGLTTLLDTMPLPPGARHDHADVFHGQLVEASARREIVLAHAKLESDLRSGHLSAEAYLEKITDAASLPEARKVATLKSQLGELLDEIEDRKPAESFGFGIPALDRMLDGGIRRGELVTVAGPTGGGKSLLLSMATHEAAKSGVPVFFVSLEMPAKAILRRIVASHGNVSLSTPRGAMNKRDVGAITAAVHAVAKMPLTISDQLDSLAEIAAEARRLVKLGKAVLVVVDYIQRVRHTNADTREQAVSEITSRLKSLALRADCAVLTASQLNRQGDVRESASIEFDSDAVLKITDGGIYGQKFRRGPSNWIVPVVMRGELGRFEQEGRQ
ncbi:MAG: DnaB-like helicase C-terminal domain-containing protein [Terrimicrobiaceae bacterium]|nr:DnaB-like helicase C-terminal domain-containing protein [Terrimicrobiaceae bacterium]